MRRCPAGWCGDPTRSGGARRRDAPSRSPLHVVLLFAGLCVATPRSLAQESSFEALPESLATDEGGRRWWDLRALPIEGQAWEERAHPYDRLPAAAKQRVRKPVWELSRHSAGLAAHFITDSGTIDVRWTLTSDQLAMPHMPATGVSGLDLYVRHEGSWRWVRNARPKGLENSENLVRDLEPGLREYLLYLPLYNGVTSVRLGLDPTARLGKCPEREKPVVFYGTSITQGACASRPGMAHVALLGRRLDRPVVNLGFSGNGRLEATFIELLADIEASAYVLDCLPNLDAGQVRERAFSFVAALRERRPHTPILLVEDRTYADAPFQASRRRRNETSRAALREAYERLLEAGCESLYYLEGDRLLGDDGDDTVDGSHPSDLGFLRHADAFEPVLRDLLEPD